MENRREKTNARRLTRLAGYLLFAAVCKTAGSFLPFGWETAVSAAGFLLPAAAELHRGRRFFFPARHRLTAFLRLLWLFPVTALAGWAGEALFGASGTPVLPSNPILCLLTQAALPALAEETFFRGVLLKGLTEIRGTKTAVFCSALAFALFHSDPAGIIRAFFAGLILGWGASVSSSFLPVLFHFAYNAGVLLTDNRWIIPAASLLLFLLLLPFLLGKVRKNDGRY